MKRLLIILLLVLMITTMASCGKEKYRQTENDTPQTVQAAQPTETTAETTEKVTEQSETEASIEVPKADINWTEFSYNTEDSDGYSYSIKVKISPWVLISNTEIVDSIWNEVCQDKQLPGFGDWSLEKYNSSSYNNLYTRNDGKVEFYHEMTDMYYCIGTIKIENTTNGWEITKQAPRNTYAGLLTDLKLVNETHRVGAPDCLCRAFFSNTTQDSRTLWFNIKMESNNMSFPFILMAPENFTPNYPNGVNYEDVKNAVFYTDPNGTSAADGTKIGIIGKDGVYDPPAD